MFRLVDDAGKARSDDDNLLRQFHQFYNGNPCYGKASKFETPQFKISHYAGEVIYDVKGFVEKNQDQVSDFILKSLATTKNSLL